MTIAAGIMCADGIVMCVDSQETYGEFKWPVKKLAFPRVTTGDFSILISGAGFGSAIDAATQKIFDRTAMSGPSYDQTLRIIQDTLREICDKDLRCYPTNDPDSLQFRLLIAFNAGGSGGLFVSDGSLLTRVESFEIIGSGQITSKFFAHMMYRKSVFDSPEIGIAEGSVLAAFLVYLAKSQLTSIGGKSQIATIDRQGIRFANVWEAPAWESVFSESLGITSDIILECASPSFSEKDFKESLQKHEAKLKKLKKSIVQKRAQWDQLWHTYNKAGVTLVGHSPTPSNSQT